MSEHKSDRNCEDTFTSREYIGHEVYRSIEGKEIITGIGALDIGDIVFVPDPFGGESCWWRLIVTERHKPDELFAQSSLKGGMGAMLEFGKDDRACWVTGCFMNLDSIKQVNFE